MKMLTLIHSHLQKNKISMKLSMDPFEFNRSIFIADYHESMQSRIDQTTNKNVKNVSNTIANRSYYIPLRTLTIMNGNSNARKNTWQQHHQQD